MIPTMITCLKIGAYDLLSKHLNANSSKTRTNQLFKYLINEIQFIYLFKSKTYALFLVQILKIEHLILDQDLDLILSSLMVTDYFIESNLILTSINSSN